jgi:hypothetical protein
VHQSAEGGVLPASGSNMGFDLYPTQSTCLSFVCFYFYQEPNQLVILFVCLNHILEKKVVSRMGFFVKTLAMVRIFLREILRAILCWVEATLRDFARKSAITFNSVQQYSSDFERIQIRSLKIRRFVFGFEENYLGGNEVALFSIRDSNEKL